MKQSFRILLVTVGFLLAASVWAELKDFEGKPYKLEDFTGKGKWTVVMFWASDCHVCNAEVQQYIQFHQAHKGENASILGVTLDGQSKLAAARDFVKRHSVTFPNLVGEPEEIADLYHTLTGTPWVGTPTFLVYDPKGGLKAAQPGAVPSELIEQFIKDNNKPANP